MQDLPNAIFTELLGSLHGAYGGAATWGQINGTLANQADLVAAIAAATGGWTTLRLTSDVTSTSATMADVTGLAFTPAVSAQYEVQCVFLLRSATTTVGARVGVVFPTNVGDGVVFSQMGSAAGSTTPRYGNTSTGSFDTIWSDVGDTTGSWPGILNTTFLTAANASGDFKIQFRTETAATQVTMRAGSFIKYRRIA